ncbi:TrbI/VirB10 family protein, partial [Pseudomonas amygdali pv. morsprunorum]|uniref:TrbI/VirB10 family protein n=1 Tax=Pseudomonas amygdali TaxID=47877 RepID=UPI002890FA84
MTQQADENDEQKKPENLVQGSVEPEVNKHANKRRSPLIYKILAALALLVVLGYLGFRLYLMYRDVTDDDTPVSKAPESSVSSAKRRVDLGKNTQFFEAQAVAPVAGDPGSVASGSAPALPPTEQVFKKYLSIPVLGASNSVSSPAGSPASRAPEPDSEAENPDSATPEATEGKDGTGGNAVAGMKVESIAMDPNLYIEENTYIPCTLLYRLVSDVSGRITCTISEDVYSANGMVKLIEKGTKAFGWYKTGTLAQGQARMAVI